MTHPDTAEVERVSFIGWIADRFQERHVPPLGRGEAIKMADGCLEAFEDMDGSAFGNPQYDWSKDAAHAIADEEIHAGWESAP
jgi:hypothetical protein